MTQTFVRDFSLSLPAQYAENLRLTELDLSPPGIGTGFVVMVVRVGLEPTFSRLLIGCCAPW